MGEPLSDQKGNPVDLFMSSPLVQWVRSVLILH